MTSLVLKNDSRIRFQNIVNSNENFSLKMPNIDFFRRTTRRGLEKDTSFCVILLICDFRALKQNNSLSLYLPTLMIDILREYEQK